MGKAPKTKRSKNGENDKDKKMIKDPDLGYKVIRYISYYTDDLSKVPGIIVIQ